MNVPGVVNDKVAIFAFSIARKLFMISMLVIIALSAFGPKMSRTPPIKKLQREKTRSKEYWEKRRKRLHGNNEEKTENIDEFTREFRRLWCCMAAAENAVIDSAPARTHYAMKQLMASMATDNVESAHHAMLEASGTTVPSRIEYDETVIRAYSLIYGKAWEAVRAFKASIAGKAPISEQQIVTVCCRAMLAVDPEALKRELNKKGGGGEEDKQISKVKISKVKISKVKTCRGLMSFNEDGVKRLKLAMIPYLLFYLVNIERLISLAGSKAESKTRRQQELMRDFEQLVNKLGLRESYLKLHRSRFIDVSLPDLKLELPPELIRIILEYDSADCWDQVVMDRLLVLCD